MKRFRHPQVGEVHLRFENLDVAGGGTQRLVVFSAEPGSAAESALGLLTMLSATMPSATMPSAPPTPRPAERPGVGVDINAGA